MHVLDLIEKIEVTLFKSKNEGFYFRELESFTNMKNANGKKSSSQNEKSPVTKQDSH